MAPAGRPRRRAARLHCPPKQAQCKSAVAPPSDPMHESTHTTATRHAPRIGRPGARAWAVLGPCGAQYARVLLL